MKRLLSVFLSAAMSVGAAVPVYAAESGKLDMQGALVKTKSIISVPPEYSEFAYEAWQTEKEGRVWSFTWSKPGGDAQISAGMSEKGGLNSYYKWENSETQTGLSPFTKKDGEKAAEAFLFKTAPYLKNSVRLTDTYSYTGDPTLSYTCKMIKNGIPADFTSYNLGVNKHTLEVTSFYSGNTDADALNYPDVTNIISEESAKESFIDKIGIDLKYYVYNDYQERTRKVFAAYAVSDKASNFAVNALTGGEMEIRNDFYYGGRDMGASGSSAQELKSMDDSLTPEEIKGIDEESKLLSKETALEIVKKYTGFSQDTQAYLNSDYFEKTLYTWSLYFENGYARVDAKTGELYGFGVYNYETKNKDTQVSIDDAKAAALEMIKKISPEKAAKVKFTKDNTYYDYGDTYSLRFSRFENGTECASNYINAEVNRYTKEIEGYDTVWYSGISFPVVKPALSKEAVFERIKAASAFEAAYVMDKNENPAAVYRFLDNSVYIDPSNGTRLDSKGNKYTEQKEAVSYDDISGHWSESAVSVLFENGVYLEGRSFYPDKDMTQGDFLTYLYKYSYPYMSLDNIYDRLINRGVITKDDKNPDALVSRKEAAKFVCALLGYEKLGEKSEIFVNPYKDNNDPKYSGYVTICRSLGIISEGSGYFRPDSTLKRGESAVMVLNTLSVLN